MTACACRTICVGHYRVAGCAHSDPLEIPRVKAAESLAGREVRESELGASWIFGLRLARYSFNPRAAVRPGRDPLSSDEPRTNGSLRVASVLHGADGTLRNPL